MLRLSFGHKRDELYLKVDADMLNVARNHSADASSISLPLEQKRGNVRSVSQVIPHGVSHISIIFQLIQSIECFIRYANADQHYSCFPCPYRD